jgi:drug/metabolite transporter (DMT)-like permease
MNKIQKWEKHQKEKLLGYIIRFFAVIIWGIQPLYIKYTAVNDVPLDSRILFIAFGGALSSVVILLLFLLFKQKSYWKPKLQINTLLVLIIIGELLFIYLSNKSLMFTSGTNFIIFNNFAPLLAVLVAIVLWRNEIPYLKEKSHIALIVLVFFIGGLGSSLIFYNDISLGLEGTIDGNFLALLATSADVLLVVAQIRYVKYLQHNQSIFLNFYVYLFLAIAVLPIKWLSSSSSLMTLSEEQIYFTLGAGVLSGIGQILNYEAFRRMDGFIAFLMFNIAILITFVLEAYWLEEIVVTYMLVGGGLLIIGASIFAEVINTKCEKKEFKSNG